MISLPNPFTDSAAFHPLAVDTVAALTSQPPVAAAVPIPVSPGVFQGSLPSGEIEPSVMLACAPGESTDDIHEIFHYARLLIAEDVPNSCAGCQNLAFAYEGIDGGARYRCETCGKSVYVPPGATPLPLDVEAFMEAIEPPPLFLQAAQ